MEPTLDRFRIYLLTAVILTGFGVLLTRLYEFQIERRDEFLNQVPGNRTVHVREPGIRGEITDRHGVPLARNLRTYEVTFNLDEIVDAYRQHYAEAPTETRLSRERGMTRAREERDIVAIVNTFTIRRLIDLGLARNYNSNALRTHYVTHGGLVPFSYRTDLTYEEFARFAEHNLELPGVYLSTRPVRQYPYGSLASHVLGYVKPWEKGDVPESAARRFHHYIGEEKGVGGVEATMNELLRGPEGHKTILKDEKGRNIAMTDYIKPGIGAKLQLTLDARIQYLVENVLRRTGRAAAVVMDVHTGEVLAMASVPDYTPGNFVPSISEERWQAYLDNQKMGPFDNRAIMGFSPGSTFKVPTAIAGAIQGMATRSFSCDGFVTYGTQPVRCWLYTKQKGRHGSLDLVSAIQRSCNPYFNKLANTIGWRNMVEGFQLVGFGATTGIELPAEQPGILPGSRAWRGARPNAVMTQHETALLSIGQGNAMASPLQLCAMTAAVANGGKYYQPRIVRQALAEDGSILLADEPRLKVDLLQSGLKAADLDRIRQGMWHAVHKPGGTASRVRHPSIQTAAKTGTAQTVDNGRPSHNSWVISFAPYENPKYAVCVMVQNAGSGGAVCGPLVHLIYRGLFAAEEGLRLPLKAQTEFRGNTTRIEELELPKDVLAAIDAFESADEEHAADDGETGDEVGDIPRAEIVATPTPSLPTPVITPEIDDEGSIIPRAEPVRE
jgi:penicillin-binding protein 2